MTWGLGNNWVFPFVSRIAGDTDIPINQNWEFIIMHMALSNYV